MLGTFDAVLTEAKWTPNKLGTEINAWLVAHGYARDRIHPTAPYHWRRTGNAPSGAAVAAAAAHVLSGRVGRVITVGQLWPAADTGADGPRQATLGLLGPGTPDDAVARLDELTRPGAPYLPGSESLLITAALDGLHGVQRPQTHTAAGDRVLPPALEVIRQHIAALRKLDDRAGGGALSLRYVRAELRAVLELIQSASYSPQVGIDLLRAAAELAQLAGWMWFDSGDVGTAQRAYLLGLRLGSAAEDTDGVINMLGMLAYIAAHSGSPAGARRLAETATTRAQARGPVLRARIAGRLATAHAAAGDLYGYRSAADQARQLLERPQLDPPPESLYYFSPAQLDAESGQALVDLAAHNPTHRRALLTEATTLLTPLTTAGPDVDHQRSALLHGCYLAQAHLRRGDVEQACHVTRTALTRLASVQSGRCIQGLQDLRTVFGRSGNPWARDLVTQVNEALSTV